MSGYSGVCASGWIVFADGNTEPLERKVLCSRKANRDPWPARIMAIKGVVEFAERGSRVRVRLNDKVTVNALASRFIKTNRKPMESKEEWQPLLDLAAEKGIDLTAEVVGLDDATMASLANETSEAAERRLADIGEEQALTQVVGPKAKSGPQFTEVERGYEQKPTLIRRSSRKSR